MGGMAVETPYSYTSTLHSTTYPSISPSQPNLSTTGKTVVIIDTSEDIGRAAALSFLSSYPKALVTVDRRPHSGDSEITKDLWHVEQKMYWGCRKLKLKNIDTIDEILCNVASQADGIDIVVYCTGTPAPFVGDITSDNVLLNADPKAVLERYKAKALTALVVAQETIKINQVVTGAFFPVTFINLTTMDIRPLPVPTTGANISSEMAAIKLLLALAAECPEFRLINVHPGYPREAVSKNPPNWGPLTHLYDDVSLPANFLVWAASLEADFLRNKIVMATEDVNELIARSKDIVGGDPPDYGELCLTYKGFPKYDNGWPLIGGR